MKKLTTALMFSATALLAACNNESPKEEVALAEPTAITKIVIGLDDNFPPMGFRNENNELVGFDIDMARETSKRMGVEAEFKPIDWSAKEAELNSKRVDVLWNGLTITDERKKNIGFTDPYMENHQIIIVAANSPIQSKADLANRVVGAQEGSSAVDAIKKEADIANSFKDLKTFGDNITALMDLSTGRLDAVVVDEVVGRYYIAKRANEYRVLPDHFGTEDYGVGTRKEDTELLSKINTTLKEMKQDGSAEKIANQWFGANLIK
jgi:polar amino acid transport system substrate-binding protein